MTSASNNDHNIKYDYFLRYLNLSTLLNIYLTSNKD